MDSDAAGFFLNTSNLHSVFYQDKEEDGVIDLGLSLRTIQPEAYHEPGHCLDGYGEPTHWPQFNPQLNDSNTRYTKVNQVIQKDCHDEADGVQSKERQAYVKVNMDGIVVGRKVCILDHAGYLNLALQLEDMFGRQTVSGLRLFQAGSEFALFYKDGEGNWRTAGDVPWKEFVARVNRLRIVRKNGSPFF